MIRQLFIFLFLTIPSARSAGQNQDIIHNYSTENGLPSNGILGLQWEEKTKFLWIATEAGLVRFNGLEFKVFNKENTPKIATDRMVFLLRNHYGNIYTADRFKNTYRVEKNKVSFYRKFSAEESKPENLFMIGISEKFMEKHLLRKNKFTYQLPFDRIVTLNDSVCFFRKDSMLVRYDEQAEREIRISPDNANVRRLFKIDSLFYIQNDKGNIFSFNPYSEKFEKKKIFDENNNVISASGKNSLICWENGMKNPILFVGSSAWILRQEKGEIKAEIFTRSIPENAFISFAKFSDEDKTLFIGTDSKGIVIISKKKVFPVKSPKTGINERNAYYGQIELENGNILTNEGTILGNSSDQTNRLPVKGNFFFSAFNTGDSTLWYSRHGDSRNIRLCRFDYRTGQTRVYEKIRYGEQAAVTKSGNDYYLATIYGIGKLIDDSLQYLFHFPEENTLYDIKEYRPGIFLVPSCGGLLQYDLTQNRIDTILRAGENCVRTITILKENYVLIGTFGNGLYMWDGKTVRLLPLDKNKYLLYVHCFVPDKYGFCWISTNKGLFRAKLSDMIEAFQEPGSQPYYHYYGKNDGMDITELNGGCQPCALLLKNGLISFPSMDGLLWVNPSQPINNLPSGEIYIDNIFADGKLIQTDSLENISFSPETEEIMVSLSYNGWAGKENIYLEYTLNEGKTWTALPPDNFSEIRLNNLPPGDYQLILRKLNGFGAENYETLKIDFKIQAPWYKQTWLYLLAGLLLAGLILLIYKWRLRQLTERQRKLEEQVETKTKELQQKNDALEKANSIKNRLISIISHDIITPLKFLNVAGKNLLDKRNTMPDSLQKETIEEMTNTARELQFLSTNILNLIKYQSEKRIVNKEKFKVHKLVEEAFGILKATAGQKKIILSNEVETSLEIYQFYDLLRILVYNLVLNGLNFSDKGTIRVSNKKEGVDVVITVTDEGVGMTAEQINNLLSDEYIISSANLDKRKGNGLGYLIIKDLAAMMRAKISIQSEPGKGTSVSIHLPTQKRKSIP